MAFTYLRSASLSEVGSTPFQHLATLDHLEELRIMCDSEDLHFLPGSFPALQRLNISEWEGGKIVPCVISSMSSASLVSLTVSFQEKLSADALGCVEGLSSLPALLHLRHLDICVYCDFDASDDLYIGECMEIELSDVLRLGPLLYLHALEDVILSVDLRVWSISDDDIETMKNAWPRLVHLSIRDDRHGELTRSAWPDWEPTVDRPSLSALVVLAQSCRQLKILDIEVADVSEEELVQLEAQAAQTPRLSPQTALRR